MKSDYEAIEADNRGKSQPSSSIVPLQSEKYHGYKSENDLLKCEERRVKQGASGFKFVYFSLKILQHHILTHREIAH